MARIAPADQQSVRRHNLSLIVAEVAARAGSRAELAQRTGLTKATVSALVDLLLAQEVLVEGVAPSDRVGRPARPIAINPDGPPGLGLEVNVDYVAAGLLGLAGEVRARSAHEIDNRRRSAAEIAADLVRLARQLPLPVELAGVALAMPGVVGPDQELVRAPNLPQLTGAGLARTVSDQLAHPIELVDNEANFGALGCRRGLDTGPDYVYVSGEIGVGAGLVVDGALFRGSSGFAGELGHVVVRPDGPACGCGGQGCVEQYAGQDVLLRAAGATDLDALMGAVAAAETPARAAVQAAGAALGVGLASLLNLVDLPVIVLGGLYARLFDGLVPSLRAELDHRIVSGRPPRLLRSTVGTDAAVLGAAGAAVQRVLNDPGVLLV